MIARVVVLPELPTGSTSSSPGIKSLVMRYRLEQPPRRRRLVLQQGPVAGRAGKMPTQMHTAIKPDLFRH